MEATSTIEARTQMKKFGRLEIEFKNASNMKRATKDLAEKQQAKEQLQSITRHRK